MPKRPGVAIFYTFLALFGVINVFSSTIFSGFKSIQPDLGDSIFNSILLEHTLHVFFNSEYKATLYSPIFFYPTKLALTFSDNLLGSAPIYWLLRSTFDNLLSFQIWEVAIVVLTFIAYLIFLRFLNVNYFVAGVIGFIFSFGTFRALSIAHPQLFAQFYTPLFWIFFIKLLRAPSLKYFNLAILMVFLQCLAGYYLGWFLIFSLFIFFPVFGTVGSETLRDLFEHLSLQMGRVIKWLFIWGALFLIFWGPYFYTSNTVKYQSNFQEVGQERAFKIIDQLPSINNYLDPPLNGIYDYVDGASTSVFIYGYGNYLFPGLFGVLTILLGYKILKSKPVDLNGKLVRAFYITGVFLTLLTFKVGNYSLWVLIYNFFPGADGVRYVYRIWLISYFYLFTAVALYWKDLNLDKNLKSILLIIFFAEQFIFLSAEVYKNDFVSAENRVAPQLTHQNCSVFYIDAANRRTDTFLNILAAMSTSIKLNIPVINGYSGIAPINFFEKHGVKEVKKFLPKNFVGELCYIHTDAKNNFSLEKILISR